jgi:hypothetical protein
MIFAQLERETIQMRIKDNYYSRGEQGFYLGGHAPYGFRKIGSTLYNKKTCTFETETETSANVKKIYDLYANTDMSLGKLFRYMKDENSGDDITNVVFIRRILRNPVYVRANADVYLYLQQKGATMNNDIEEYIGVNGIYIYGDRKNQTKSKFSDLSKDFATIGLHEGFIDAEIWLRCQRKLDQNKQLKKSGAGTHSWLSGIWKCKYCGFAINVVNNCRGHFYINCGGKIRKMCKGREKTYEVYQIEEVVQQSLFDYLNEKQSVETAADIIVSDTYESNRLKIDIAKIDKAIDKLLEQAAFSDDVVGDYFTKKIKELDRKKHQLTEQLEDMYKQQNSKRKIQDINISEISANWDNWNIEQKKAIVKRIIRLVEVSDEGIEIHYI